MQENSNLQKILENILLNRFYQSFEELETEIEKYFNQPLFGIQDDK